jgi:predicted esterase
MAHRRFSMIKYFTQREKDWQPLLSFRGQTVEDWKQWRQEALAKLMALMGEFPKPVDLAAETIYAIEDNGLIRERVIFDAEEEMSVPCVVLRPVDMPADKKGRAILCSHGHGPFGKDSVAGNATTPERRTNIAKHHYNYGEEMARRGFLTICPDLRIFGERSDGGDPYPGDDRCNVHFVRGVILGIYTLTLNIFDMKRCIDYLETRPEVDPQRIGMMGLSQGGTMTTFTSAVEPRIKAADIIGYVNTWNRFREQNCGSQVLPNIYKYLDTHDIAGLIAPRPLLLEMGIHDTCFPIEAMLAGYEAVRRIYRAAGVEDRLWAEVHPGEHGFAANQAYAFFERYL